MPRVKRGLSGLSLVVGVNKPAGMSSHDVVNRCRSIFGERRVGHTGTLDPMATGVLPICVGPATRLGAYLTGHDKRYRVSIAFGAGTDTDDAAGTVVRTGEVPDRVLDPEFAAAFVASLVGRRKQMPPAYSAIKVNGKKSYEAARAGNIIDLAPRDIEVYDARLLGVHEGDGEELPSWDVSFEVSKGTYIRSLARDAGVALGCPAHVAALERTELGLLTLEECVSLETLADLKDRAALDPVRLLGVRFSYAQGDLAKKVANGAQLPAAELPRCERRSTTAAIERCACTAGGRESCEPPRDGELVAVLTDNVAVRYYATRGALSSRRCVFQTGVSRLARITSVDASFDHGFFKGTSCAFSVFSGVHRASLPAGLRPLHRGRNRRRQRGADVRHRSGRGVPSNAAQEAHDERGARAHARGQRRRRRRGAAVHPRFRRLVSRGVPRADL